MSFAQKVTKIPRSLRHVKRYREIIFILVKYGLGNIVGQTKRFSFRIFSSRKKWQEKEANFRKKSVYARIRMAMDDLGPTFVKFGQLLSNRPDILPMAFIEELEQLQKHVKPFDFKEAKNILEKEASRKCSETFLDINPEPLASGSIAQVHLATLKTGEKVIVKIQRPGIAKQIETDIEIMQYMAKVFQRQFPDFKSIDALSIINEFKCSIKRELDFNQEAANIERFRTNFEKDKDIYIPKLYNRHCSRKIIVMEYIEGYMINDLFIEENHGINPISIAKKGANFVLNQIFTYGFFHADPHPGNIIILADSRICFIDFGMTGTLPYKYRVLLSDFILGFVARDTTLLVKVLKRFVKDDAVIDLNELELRVSELVDEFTYMPLNKIDSTEIMNRLLALLVHFRLDLPPVIYMLLKTMVTIEGVARKLDPEFNITEYVAPFAKKLLKTKMNPFEFAKRNYTKVVDFSNFMLEFPGTAVELSEMLRDGNLKIGLEKRSWQPFIENSQRNNYHLVLAIISTALFLSSSMLIMAKIPPFWNQISVLGILGYGLAGLLGLVAILKSRKNQRRL